MAEHKHGPLDATDRRRHKHHPKAESSEGKGEAHPLANLFHDRRHGHNGMGSAALSHYRSHASKE